MEVNETEVTIWGKANCKYRRYARNAETRSWQRPSRRCIAAANVIGWQRMRDANSNESRKYWTESRQRGQNTLPLSRHSKYLQPHAARFAD